MFLIATDTGRLRGVRRTRQKQFDRTFALGSCPSRFSGPARMSTSSVLHREVWTHLARQSSFSCKSCRSRGSCETHQDRRQKGVRGIRMGCWACQPAEPSSMKPALNKDGTASLLGTRRAVLSNTRGMVHKLPTAVLSLFISFFSSSLSVFLSFVSQPDSVPVEQTYSSNYLFLAAIELEQETTRENSKRK